jgi:hypothetical protein
METATKHLEDRGYMLTSEWTWWKPPSLRLSEDDLSAIGYLIDEWDYGGLCADSRYNDIRDGGLVDPADHPGRNSERLSDPDY